ncbi:MAG TPA: DNA-binding protein [Candidatus Poseidoniales archaeon]|nr:DNA-binding protein [Candidatus Poseidoniales archaeon]
MAAFPTASVRWGVKMTGHTGRGDYDLISIPGFADPVASIMHLTAASVALVAGILMIWRFRGPGLHRFGLMVFVFGTVFMFSMSGVYHLLGSGGTARYVLQHLDHAAIWVMIAGTFTPLHLMLFRGWQRWGILTVIWIAAINGLVLKTVFFTTFPEWLSVGLYLALGWAGAFSAVLFVRRWGFENLHWLAFGGLSYSVGAVLQLIDPPFLIPGVIGTHELWHLFVVIGAFCHWRMVELGIVMSANLIGSDESE